MSRLSFLGLMSLFKSEKAHKLSFSAYGVELMDLKSSSR